MAKTRDWAYVKGLGFLSFAKNMGVKSVQKLIDATKISATDCLKIFVKEFNPKTS